VLLVGTLFFFLGPFDRQVLHNEHVVFKAWRMYSGFGTEGCVADFWLEGPDGSLTEIDRLYVLYQVRHWSRATPKQRTLRDHAAVGAAGMELCRALDASVVRADAKCASTRRWKVVEDRQRNLCLEAAPAPRRGKRR
jgi:hypothetical protein